MTVKIDEGALLTVREAAQVLNISAYTLRRWVKMEKIEAVRLSRKGIRFELDRLRRWIRLHRLQTREE